jgi:FkbM family methyltransferase
MSLLKYIYNLISGKIVINFIKNLPTKYFNLKYNKITEILHNGTVFQFHTPNWLTLYRAETFSTKEPETLEWIDNFETNSVFWDIGANVGLYSIYATKVKNTITYAFEPSVFNLELLAKNINANNLEKRINILPIALSDCNNINTFNMSHIEWGSALSTFSKSYDANGKDLNIQFSYNTIGLRADDAVNIFNLQYPKYLKIDVDGIEHLILTGMPLVLESAEEILIELSNVFKEQIEICTTILISKGFILSQKYIETDINISTNQIWKKQH